MWLKKAAHTLSEIVELIGKYINAVAGAFLVAIMFLMAADVLLRYIFNAPIPGAFEITEYMMVVLVSWSLAYCVILKGYVKVEVIYQRLSPRTQTILDSIGYLFIFGLFSLITEQSIRYIGVTYNDKMTSSVLLIPTYPFMVVMSVGMAVFTLTILVDFINYVTHAVQK